MTPVIEAGTGMRGTPRTLLHAPHASRLAAEFALRDVSVMLRGACRLEIIGPASAEVLALVNELGYAVDEITETVD